MGNREFGAVLRQIGRLARRPQGDATDGLLLELFAHRHDEAAFTALVERHGRLVLHVCRSVLRQEQDAEDAFQATFLVLARKASSIRKAGSVASWLHGVAYRLAHKARTAAARRRAREQRETDVARDDTAREVDLRELQALLDEEINRLPQKLRAPFVLCCLEGKTKPEAAQELGWKEGTVSGRLAQARERLRHRLDRRGVALPAALATAALATSTVPKALAAGTVRAALAFVAGSAASVAVPVRALAEGALQAMAITRGKIVLAVVLALAAAGTGTGMMMQQAGSNATAGPSSGLQGMPLPARASSGVALAPADGYGDALPAGALARLGTVRFRHQHTVRSLAVSRDGTNVVSGSWDGTVRVWDAATGKELHRFGGGGLSAVAFSPDGRQVAAGDMARSLALWDLETGRRLWHAPDQENSVMGIRFAPDGRTVASVSGASIKLWDAATGKEIRRFTGPDKGIYCIDLSPDGKVLAGGCQDKTIRLWDVATGQQRHCLKGHQDTCFSVAFSPDGKLLASGGGDTDRTVRLWDPVAGKEVGRIPTTPNWIRPIAFSPDGKCLAVGTGQSAVHLYDVSTRSEMRSLRLPGSDDTWVMAVAFSPDGKVLFTAGTEKIIRRWDVATGEEINPFAGHQHEVRKVLPSRDGKTVISAGADGLVCVWDTASRRLTRQLRTGRGLSAVSLSADGSTLATAEVGVVTLWDLAAGKERRQFRGHRGGVDAVALSPDGRRLASGSWQDHTIRLWGAATGAERSTIKLPMPRGHNYGAVPLLFSADGRVLFSGSADRMNLSLYLWDPETGKELRRLDLQASHLALSRDGKLLAVTGGEKVITLVDTATGRARGRITAEAGALAFSPDGRVLAGGGVRGRIQLWELATLTERRSFQAHQPGGDDQGSFAAGVSALAFAGDGRTLISGGGDTTILLWDAWGPAGTRLREGAARPPEQVWKDLGASDGAVGFRAMQALAATPREAVGWLKANLRPAAKADAERIRRAIARLDSNQFAERQQATAELEEAGDAARAYLEEALASAPPPEARRRLVALLDRLNNPPTGDRLAAVRAVEVLERLASPDARQWLEVLARGDEAALLTREAAAAVRRLDGQSPR